MYFRGLCDEERDDVEEGCFIDDELGVSVLVFVIRLINMV